MHFTSITPMLYTEQIEETIQFYTTYLGFICGEKNDDWDWAAMHRDDVDIMLAKPNGHIPFDKPTFSGSIYIKVEDVEAIWDKVKDKVKVCYPLETFD